MLSGFEHRFVPGSLGPTLLLLHGTGGGENDLLDLGAELLPGAALLSPRGKVSESGMNRFFRRVREGVFDVADVRFRAAELSAFLDEAARHYGFDRARVIAAGYSNGANVAAALLLEHPASLAAAVLLHALAPLTPEAPPALAGKPVFITAGRQDRLVPAAESQRLAGLLAGFGARVELHWEPGGHGLAPREIEAAKAWLAGLSV